MPAVAFTLERFAKIVFVVVAAEFESDAYTSTVTDPFGWMVVGVDALNVYELPAVTDPAGVPIATPFTSTERFESHAAGTVEGIAITIPVKIAGLTWPACKMNDAIFEGEPADKTGVPKDPF